MIPALGRQPPSPLAATADPERQGATDISDNVRGALHTIGENAGHIKQGLAKLRAEGPHQSSGPRRPACNSLFGLCAHAVLCQHTLFGAADEPVRPSSSDTNLKLCARW
jgi:hypothetical protein